MLTVSLVLIVLSDQNVASLYGGCVTVSALVHYFTLVAVMWMGAEALFMFQKLVLVFVEITTKYIIIVSVICWGKSQQGFVKPHVAQLDKPLVTVHYCALSYH